MRSKLIKLRNFQIINAPNFGRKLREDLFCFYVKRKEKPGKLFFKWVFKLSKEDKHMKTVSFMENIY